MKDLYNTNANFKQYVDTYSSQRGITLDEALELKVVQLVGEYYREEAKENEHRIYATTREPRAAEKTCNCS